MPQCGEKMVLDVIPAPRKQIRSLYRKGKPGFPARLSFFHPRALKCFVNMQHDCGWNIVLSDMWRASHSSFIKKFPPGKASRRFSLWPAWSGHNYGFSVDVDVGRTLKLMKAFLKKEFGFSGKKALDLYMEQFGFYCHRRDHKRDREEWHFNWLSVGHQVFLLRGSGTALDGSHPGRASRHPDSWYDRGSFRKYSSYALQKQIQSYYSRFWSPTTKRLQQNLSDLHLYRGEIDGRIGPLSKGAIAMFQRAWKLKADSIAGAKTNRILSFRVAEISHPEIGKLRNVSLSR